MIGAADDRRGRRLIVLATLLGAGLAAAGILRSGRAPLEDLPADAMALVDGVPISRESFAQFVGAVAQERREISLDEKTKRELLDRMIDEELLLQRGLSLDLARFERTARRAIVAAVVAMVSADAEAGEPSEADLRAFFEAERGRFRRPDRVALDVVSVSIRDGRPEAAAYQRARDAASRLRAGDDPSHVAADLGDPLPGSLPAGSLSADQVQTLLGAPGAAAVQALGAGETSEPVRTAAGWVVVTLRARETGDVPPFDELRSVLRTEWQRAAGERAVSAYLGELRGDAKIVVAPALRP